MKDLKKKLVNFELKIKKIYESGKIKAPIHLSGGNETQLIKNTINNDRWVPVANFNHVEIGWK